MKLFGIKLLYIVYLKKETYPWHYCLEIKLHEPFQTPPEQYKTDEIHTNLPN